MPTEMRKIGLSLGADICWPLCFEQIVDRLQLDVPWNGQRVGVEVERLTIEPFDLRQGCSYDLVIDRLTHWYHVSREWIKKAVIMDGLYVFNNPAHYKGRSSVADAFSYLAEEMEPIGTVPAEKLAKGAALTNAIRLRCPVTNQVAVFDDFECIAFCPQSDDRDDPLYDPLLYAPFTAVNMSSDVYAFSRFVADSALAPAGLGKSVYEEKDVAKIAAFFDQCVERWHRVAMSIIERFEAATDTALCPVHVTAERTHWIAGHKDPAFAEDRKEAHSHELPVIYGKRLVQRWLDFFQDERPFDVGGLARDGVRTGEC